MPLPSIIECCRSDLMSPANDLADKYPAPMVERIVRIRDIYNIWIQDPTMRDRELRDIIMDRYGVAQSTAYSDIKVLHEIAPLFSKKSRDFHRMRFAEMSLETYSMARDKGDTRSMAAITATYGKMTKVDQDDDPENIYDRVPVQPFCASTDPGPLGLKPIPDIYNYIDRLTKDLLPDHPDIQDVEFEEADLEEDLTFAPQYHGSDQSEG